MTLSGPIPPASGAEMISAERQRQVAVEGWTPGHDDVHTDGELAYAAIAYIRSGRLACDTGMKIPWVPPEWPWDRHDWKPSGDPVRDLVKAGALIAAEIDRLWRLGVPS